MRPDPEVLELLANLTRAAENGLIRALAVVTVDPLLAVAKSTAGDEEDSGVRKRLLAAGLMEVSNALLDLLSK